MAVLKRKIRGLEAIEQRNRGEVVETPALAEPAQDADSGGTLTAAFAGWKKAKQPHPNILSEYTNAVKRFIELHGDLRIVDIRRSHARQYGEALQMIPFHRTGALKKAILPELVEWSP